MQRSRGRFLTTHTGSLPRPDDLIRMMYAKEEGVPVDPDALAARVKAAVAEVVRKQADAGIDLINDGEMSKPSYATYIKDRLEGFGGTGNTFVYQDLSDFPSLEKRVFGDPGRSRRKTPACNAPISVRDRTAPQVDIDDLKAALASSGLRRLHERGFAWRRVAVFPQRSLQGFRDVHLRHRRRHAPRIRDHHQGRFRAADRLSRPRHGPAYPVRESDVAEFRKRAQLHIEALNHAVANIPVRAGAHAPVLGQLRRPAPSRRAACRHHRHCVQGASRTRSRSRPPIRATPTNGHCSRP